MQSISPGKATALAALIFWIAILILWPGLSLVDVPDGATDPAGGVVAVDTVATPAPTVELRLAVVVILHHHHSAPASAVVISRMGNERPIPRSWFSPLVFDCARLV
jgi:hypothetical protein